MGRAPPPPGAFPSGAYGKYKRATTFFLRWLLRAREIGGLGALNHGDESTPTTHHQNATKKKKKKRKPQQKTNAATTTTAQTLDEYARIVAAIAQQPTALPAVIRRQWPRAIAACECAITLRAQVAEFFPQATDDDPHLHFLELLIGWFEQLRDANVGESFGAHHQAVPTGANGKAFDFANYYDVLDLPDDFFDHDTSEETHAPVARPLPAKERKRLTEDMFQDDEALEVAYFLLEIDELSEAVYSAFHDVKTGKKSLIEATVVTLVAVDFAKNVIAQFQLRQPSMRDGVVLYKRLGSGIPIEAIHAIADQVHETWKPSAGSTTYQYVRGVALLDLIWVGMSLGIFRDYLPDTTDGSSGTMEADFGDLYDEESTQHFTIPGFLPIPAFFLQQLRHLVNAYIRYNERDEILDRLTFTDCFFEPLKHFFETREISIELVFVCICWVRSVSALQGDAGLSRAVSVSVLHQWDLEARVRESLARISEQKSYTKQNETPFEEELNDLLGDLEFAEELKLLARANPIVAGGLMLSNHIHYLNVGTEVSMATTHLRAFSHLYSALRNRELLDEIPFFQEFVRFHEIFFFAPSRDAAAHGNFLHVYRAKSREYRATPRGQRRHKHFSGLCRCLQSISLVLRLLGHQNYKELPSDILAPTSSWKARLDHVAELCGEAELFGARILSRDLLKISDDVTDLFLALREGLGSNAEFAGLLASMDPLLPTARAANAALEEVVVPPLLSLLDCLNLDGSATLAVVRGETVVSPELGALVLPFCQRAAAIVKSHFRVSEEPSRLERRYYTLPQTPDWAAIEFGASTSQSDDARGEENVTTRNTFISLMEMMTETPEALSDEQVVRLKDAVRADPSLLSMVIEDPNVELCTLFHHVAAGRARDRRLVEWFIQMGALRRQPQHFHTGDVVDGGLSPPQNKHLCNHMAVHSAAKAGLTDMVELILEADLFRDIDKVTYHSKESLVHIAVRNNDRVLFEILDIHSADCRHKDASGKYAHDCTDDASWRRQIVETVLWQRRQHEEKMKKQKQSPRKSQRSPLDGGSKSGARTPSIGVKVASSKSLEKTMATLSIKDRIEQLTQWFDVLIAGSATDQTEIAAAALRIVDTIRASVAYFANSPSLFKISRGVAHREATDAWNALRLLTKFYRQLPAASRDLPPDDSAMGKLTQRAGPAQVFGDFMLFAMHTAYLFDASHHEAQAKETLEMLERRMLKIKPRDGTFCETVKAYLRKRRRMEFEPTLSTLAEATSVFQWMQPTTTSVAVVDALSRFTWFRRLLPLDSVRPAALEVMRDDNFILGWDPTVLCLCVGDSVVVAAHTSQALTDAVQRVVETVKDRHGVRFCAHSDADNTTELFVDGLTIRHDEAHEE